MGRDSQTLPKGSSKLVARRKRSRPGPFGLAVLKARSFSANTLSVIFLRWAHQRAAPIRLLIGLGVAIAWLWLGGSAAIDYANAKLNGQEPVAQQTATPAPALSGVDKTVQAIGNGLCVFREGKECGYEIKETRVFAAQMAFTALAFVTLFFGFWRALFDAFAKAFRSIGARHVIITGESVEAEFLARSVVRTKTNRERKAVVLIRRNASTAEVESMGADGVNLMVGDPTSIAVLRAAGAKSAYRVLALSASDAENLAAAAAIRKLRNGYAPGDVGVRLESHALRRDLPSRSGIGATDLFSLPEIAARLLTQSNRLLEDVEARPEAKGVHVAIVGWDDHAMAAAERVLRIMWVPGFHEPRVTVFCHDPNSARDEFKARFPNAFGDPGTPPGKKPVWVADIDFRQHDWRGYGNPWRKLADAESERGAISSVVVTFPTDQETLHCAAVMAGRANEDFPRMYVRDDRDSTIGAVLSAYDHVVPFAEHAQTLSPSALVDRSLDKAARRIHEMYVSARVLEKNEDAYREKLRKGDTIPQRLRRMVHWPLADADTADLEDDFQKIFGARALNAVQNRLTEKLLANGAFVPATAAQCVWDDLKEHYIETNRVAADHALLKMRSLGWVPAEPKAGGRLPTIAPDQISDDAAEVEHLRWCADKLLSGWRYGDTRNEADLVHTDLKPYADFDDASRPGAIKKDRDMWLAAPETASWIHPDLFAPRQSNAAAPL